MVSSHVWTGLRQQFLPDDRRSEEFQVLPEWSSQDWADSHCVHVQDEVLSRLESQFLDQVKSDHITGALNGRWIQAHGPCPHKPYVNLLRSKATFEWLRVPENPDCSLQHF